MTTRQRAAAAAPQPAQPMTAAEYAAAQAEEWGRYVARVAIDHFGVRAYNAGDPVPVSAVTGDNAWVPEQLVEQTGGDAAPFAGSPTVVEPTPPAVDPDAIAAPVAATPTPIVTTEG